MRRVNMEAVASELEEVKAAMVETAQMIDRVEKEIAETVRLELQAKASNDAEELRAMREKENKLREEKNKLREKENKLREKENKLREMEMTCCNDVILRPPPRLWLACSTGHRCLRWLIQAAASLMQHRWEHLWRACFPMGASPCH